MQRKGGLYWFLAYFLQFPPLINTNDTEKYILIKKRWLPDWCSSIIGSVYARNCRGVEFFSQNLHFFQR